MAKIKRYTELDGGYQCELGFMCPGCNSKHFINDALTQIPNLPPNHIWTFNGDFDKPTVRDSVLTRIYVKNNASGKYDIEANRCHSYITDGMIEFLSDCHHLLAGQIVELPQIEPKTT
ncbi:MAG TPA: DUF6527 family protein [Paludibacter sp.]|nr:DUF6527 family protein [Paludibacter sp.]